MKTQKYYWFSLLTKSKEIESYNDISTIIHPFIHRSRINKAYPERTHDILSWQEISKEDFDLFHEQED